MRISKLKIKKIKEFFQKIPFLLAKKAFLFFLGLLVLALIFGGLIFYRYNVLVKKIEIQIIEEPLKFQEKTYHNLLKIWQEKERRFQESEVKTYPKLFK